MVRPVNCDHWIMDIRDFYWYKILSHCKDTPITLTVALVDLHKSQYSTRFPWPCEWHDNASIMFSCQCLKKLR